MLTSELIRIRQDKGEIIPKYIDPEKRGLLDKASLLISIYQRHVGKTRGELEEAVREMIGDGMDYQILRGMAKLLSDRSEFEIGSPQAPVALRAALFALSAEGFPVSLSSASGQGLTRQEVIERVAEGVGMTAAEVERWMYGDLQDAYLVKSFETLEGSELIERYNLALAQAVLFRATRMRIWLRDPWAQRLRQMMRYLKFFRLIAAIRVVGEEYCFEIDGPLSIFRFCQKYGLQMSSFLPALLLCEEWRMEADLQWEDKGEIAVFRLDSATTSLRSHYPDKGAYVTEEEKYFRERWDTKKLGGWSLEPTSQVMRLGSQEIGISDYTLRSPEGKEIWLEVIGFWHRNSLLRRLNLLREYGPKHLLLAVPQRLRVSEDETAEVGDQVYFFKDVMHPKKIVEAAIRLSS